MKTDRQYILEHATKYAIEHRGLGDNDAALYSHWYADNYPEGEGSHALIIDRYLEWHPLTEPYKH